LNAPIVSEAISAYAAQLSLGVSVVEYLGLPVFEAKSPVHRELVKLVLQFTKRPTALSDADWQLLDSSARQAFSIR
jgi:hypothetical protein